MVVKIPIRVLIVDDEKDFTEMLAMRLTEAGEKVYEVYDGLGCLDFLEGNPDRVDVVILDIRMPGMDGMAVLREIRKKWPLIEVIMLTGHGTAKSAVEGMKLGAFDYLLKPADFEDLMEKLEGARQRKDEQMERIRKAEARLLVRKSGGFYA